MSLSPRIHLPLVGAACLVLAALGLQGPGRVVAQRQALIDQHRVFVDDAYWRSFGPARRAAAEAGEPMVGYLSDSAPNTLGDDQVTKAYYAAQYAMAPTLIDIKADHPLMLLNFGGPDREQKVAAALATPGVELVAPLAPGRALVKVGQH